MESLEGGNGMDRDYDITCAGPDRLRRRFRAFLGNETQADGSSKKRGGVALVVRFVKRKCR